MAKKKKEEEKQKMVCCAWCAKFRRDTEGISRAMGSGEYFMGRCSEGIYDVETGKVFADNMRICEPFKALKHHGL